jgi:hypothetical protein
MSWLTIGAIVVAGLFSVNTVVYLVRYQRKRQRGESVPPVNLNRMSRVDIFIVFVMVAAFVIGLAAPVFWPSSEFGLWMQEKYSFLVYFVWCMASAFVAQTVVMFIRQPWKRKNGAV